MNVTIVYGLIDGVSSGTGSFYSYDLAGNLTSAANAHSKLEFSYDSLDRLTRAKTSGIIAREVELLYRYDKADNLISLELADDRIGREKILYEYDKQDNLTTVGVEGENKIGLAYDALSRRTKLVYPNGTEGSFTYEPGKENRLKRVGYKKGSDNISSFTYAYDLNDQITSLTSSRSGITVNSPINYAYDVVNQVISATKPVGTGSENFTYDAVGNRLRREGETTNSTFDDNHRLVNDKKYTYTYDKNGNLTKRKNILTGKIVEYFWNYENRLIRIDKKDRENGGVTSSTSYRYDALDRRIEKKTGVDVTRYLYDRDDIVLEYDGSDEVRAKYLHGPGVDEVLKMERNDSPYEDEAFNMQSFYFHRDRLGNVNGDYRL